MNQSSSSSSSSTTTPSSRNNNNNTTGSSTFITIERTIPLSSSSVDDTSSNDNNNDTNNNNNNNNNENGTTTTTNETKNNKILKLCVLGCEPNPPYGPNEHTANMIMELFVMAITNKYYSSTTTTTTTTTTMIPIITSIIMDIYNVQEYQYPTSNDNWEQYDGIIIPGSFASAYDTDPWIIQLQNIIQSIIVPNHYKTIAICFGHQIFAHSFGNNNNAIKEENGNNDDNTHTNNDTGRACKTPTGSRAGRYEIELVVSSSSTTNSESNNNIFLQELEKIRKNEQQQQSLSSLSLLSNNNLLQLFVSHSDMVQQLPTSYATCIGGSTEVPIQIAMYYYNNNETVTSNDSSDDQQSSLQQYSNNNKTPYAITFQGHPEYATTLGYTTSFVNCLNSMCTKNLITKQHYEQAIKDSTTTLQQVQQDSITVFQITASIFGWF